MWQKKFWRDYFESILVAIFLALFVRTFIWTAYRVPTNSMAPTLIPGDFLFTYRLPYGLKLPLTQTKWTVGNPIRGEVLVFTYPDQPNFVYVKRVIGLSGDRIQIKNGKINFNGQDFVYNSIGKEPQADGSVEVEEVSTEGARQVLLPAAGVSADFGPFVVPPGEVFLIGDRRDQINSPHGWGSVPIERIEGKVELLWLSLDWDQRKAGEFFPLLRNERLFRWIH